MFIDDYMNNKRINNKIIYETAILHPVEIIGYNEEHFKNLQILVPLIGLPWFVGIKLFLQDEFTKDLIVLNTKVDVINYEIFINQHMIKCCKYHQKIIKSIYELIKDITVLENKIYFDSIPRWLGLIIHDIFMYHTHLICVDKCFDLNYSAIANDNRKMFLINREEKILELILNCRNSHRWDDFKESQYHNYNAINLLFNLIHKHSKSNNINRRLEDFKKEYKNYLSSLKTNLWSVAYVDKSGNPQIHKNKGRIPNYNPSKYNQILYFAR